ncbi:MAG: DUF3592 domain-containing protein [Betaproteobacteria bacterium]|nr:DUF3592 domain-containing protein [Betaproteobacteria bacterium]
MSFLTVDTSTRRNRIVARVGLLLLAIILLIGGLLFVWRLAFGPLVDVWRSRDWPTVPARIEAVRLTSGMEGRQLAVRYRYDFAGRAYHSDSYGLYRWRADSAALEEAYAELLYAEHMRAWVNPHDPTEALLNRDISWPVMVMAIPAFCMFFLGAALLWAALVSARDFLRERRVFWTGLR